MPELADQRSKGGQMNTKLLITALLALTCPLFSQTSVCIEDEMSLRAGPEKTSKLLTTVSIGEEVTLTGQTAGDYVKVRLSGGEEGWTLGRVIVSSAKTGVLAKSASVYSRPNLVNATGTTLEPLTIVAVVQTMAEWTEVVECKVNRPSGSRVWLRETEISYDSRDRALSVLYQRANSKTDFAEKDKLMSMIRSNSAISAAPLYSLIGSVKGLVTRESKVGEKFGNFILSRGGYEGNDYFIGNFIGHATLQGILENSVYGGDLDFAYFKILVGADQVPVFEDIEVSQVFSTIALSPIEPPTGFTALCYLVVDSLWAMTIGKDGPGNRGYYSEFQMVGQVPFKEAVCIEEGMSVRREPTAQSQLLTRLVMGEEVEWLGHVKIIEGHEYWKIKTASGVTGWSLGKAIAPGARTESVVSSATGARVKLSILDGEEEIRLSAGNKVAVLNYSPYQSARSTDEFIIPCRANQAEKIIYRLPNPIFASQADFTDFCVIGEAKPGEKFGKFTLITQELEDKGELRAKVVFAGNEHLSGRTHAYYVNHNIRFELTSAIETLPVVKQWVHAFKKFDIARDYPADALTVEYQDMPMKIVVDTLYFEFGTSGDTYKTRANITELQVLGQVPNASTVCIEEGMSVCADASGQSALLATLSMGEAVEWLGHMSRSGGPEYWKIRTSSGTTGWTLGKGLVTNAESKTLTGDIAADGQTIPAGTRIAMIKPGRWNWKTNFVICKANGASKKVYSVQTDELKKKIK